MGRRTVSNLSREMNVSRPCVYRAMERLSIQKRGGELPQNDWDTLRNELSRAAAVNAAKTRHTKQYLTVSCSANTTQTHNATAQKIADTELATLKERLRNTKQEYDFNRELIAGFQREVSAYLAEHGRTTVQTHNGGLAAIPALTNLDKYLKINNMLSKHISDLENDLDLELEEGDSPFD